MWTCKQVAKTLSEHNYQDLPWYARIGVQIHVKLCVVCGKYHTQVMDFQDGARIYRDKEESLESLADSTASDQAHNRWNSVIQAARSEHS